MRLYMLRFISSMCANFLSLPQRILFLMPLFGKAWETLDTVHTCTFLYKVWTYVIQNIRCFFRSGISRFKFDVPFAARFLICHVLGVQNAIILPVTSSNYYFFDYWMFSVKGKMKRRQKKNGLPIVKTTVRGISDESPSGHVFWKRQALWHFKIS